MISICVKTKQSGRWVRVHKEQVHIIQNAKDAGIFPTSELLAHATCGNGIEEFGESCDRGVQNGDVERGSWCTANCQIAECGNGVLEAGEQCECSCTTIMRFQRVTNFKNCINCQQHVPDATQSATERKKHWDSLAIAAVIYTPVICATHEKTLFSAGVRLFNPPQKSSRPRSGGCNLHRKVSLLR